MSRIVPSAKIENIYELPVQLLTDGRAVYRPAAAINSTGLAVYWSSHCHKRSHSRASFLCPAAHVRERGDHEVDRMLPYSPPDGKVCAGQSSDDCHSGSNQRRNDCWIH